MIIQQTKYDLTKAPYQQILWPDQFVPQVEKEGEDWIKRTMDYFANVAYAQFVRNKETFVKNYDLVKGILRPADFYEKPEVKSFTDVLFDDLELPTYVQHYSILATPINDAIGELSKRPDTHKIKAFDEDSQSQEMQFRTDILEKYVFQVVRDMISQKMAMQGQQVQDDDIDKITMEQVQGMALDYTSVAERWGNHVVTACKVLFNMKEKSEDAFRDFLIAGREFFLIYEDNSKLGFSIKCVNPKNAWWLSTPDKKWLKGAYAGGTIEVMEISEVIEEIPEITLDDINHLRKGLEDYGVLYARESNLTNPNVAPGINSINYDTYSPVQVQQRMFAESQMMGDNNTDLLSNIFGLASNVGVLGQKFVVTRAYWSSKQKIKKVTYIDEQGQPQVELTDESYTSGDIPTEISVEEGWINQWYQGTKIGPDVYYCKPFKFLNYLPLIGQIHEIKNTESRSFVDLMKPFQVLYNVCMNQLYKLLEKEIGNVVKVQLRRIPTPKDGDNQDAIDQWMMDAREAGIIFEDDSPENLKAQISNTQTTQNVDLTRTSEIRSRLELALAIKTEAYELSGFSRQRLAQVQATETATATNAALSQSYAQTEPWFTAHDYTMNQVNQGLLDACQYVESKKELSTISYITDVGESSFIQVQGSDIKNRDLWVLDTSRPEDNEMFKQLQSLAQPYMQNGGDLSEVVELFDNQSVRALKKIYRDFKKKRDDAQQQQQQQEQQLEQQKVQQQQQTIQQNEEHHQEDLQMTKYKTDVAAQTAIATAQIKTYFQAPGTDTDGNGVPDIMDIAAHSLKTQEILAKVDLENKKMSLDMQKQLDENKSKAADRQVERERIKADLKIAKAKPKPKK